MESETPRWRLSEADDDASIERRLMSLHEHVKHIVLELGAVKRVGPLGEHALLGTLGALRRRGITATLEALGIELTDARLETLFLQEVDQKADLQPWTAERFLMETVAGLVVGQMCAAPSAASRLAELQRERLQRNRWVFGQGQEVAIARTVTAEEPPGEAPVAMRFPRFEQAFIDLLLAYDRSPGSMRSSHPSGLGAGWPGLVAAFAWEAFDNAYRHGRFDLAARPIPSVRFMHWRRTDLRPRGAGKDTGEAPGPLDEYADRLRAYALANDLPVERVLASAVQFAIADGGLGVPAHMGGDLSIHHRPFADESASVERALLPGRSSAPPGQAGRGQGFQRMLRATARLHGLFQLRTGRVRAWRTYLTAHGDSDTQAAGPNGSLTDFEVETERELPLLAGTSVSLIFPSWPPTRPGRYPT